MTGEDYIANFDGARAQEVWQRAQELQLEVLELRDRNARLLAAVNEVRRIVAESWMTEERVYRLVREASDEVISKAEALE